MPKNKTNFEYSRGAVSILLVMVILIVILSIALTVSTLSIRETAMSRDIGDSTIAYQVADSGLEYALYKLYKEEFPPSAMLDPTCNIQTGGGVVGPAGNQGRYCLRIERNNGGQLANNWSQAMYIKVIGRYKDTRRGIGIRVD